MWLMDGFYFCDLAKKAYLHTLLAPPAALISPTSTTRLQIKPYDGPEAQNIIQAVQSRTHVRVFLFPHCYLF